MGYDYIKGPFAMYSLTHYPAITQVQSSQQRVIKGQLFMTDEAGLAALDRLEGHPNYYTRRKEWTKVFLEL